VPKPASNASATIIDRSRIRIRLPSSLGVAFG
jgi:hypothetical protein